MSNLYTQLMDERLRAKNEAAWARDHPGQDPKFNMYTRANIRMREAAAKHENWDWRRNPDYRAATLRANAAAYGVYRANERANNNRLRALAIQKLSRKFEALTAYLRRVPVDAKRADGQLVISPEGRSRIRAAINEARRELAALRRGLGQSG